MSRQKEDRYNRGHYNPSIVERDDNYSYWDREQDMSSRNISQRSDDMSEKYVPKNPKTFKDVLQRFCDTTSLQGIPFIRAANRWFEKMLWSLIFIAATGVWILHSVVLIRSYIEFETSSQVVITYEELDFPTITFCNINPIRQNQVETYGSDELIEFIELLQPIMEYQDDVDRRKKRSPEDDHDVDREGDYNAFSYLDFNNYRDYGSFGQYLDEGYSQSTLAKLLLEEMLIQLPDANRTALGHRLGDMLLGCNYDGITCNTRNFSSFLDIHHGRCFSFNSRKLASKSLQSVTSGASWGLELTVYLQKLEYIRGIQQGRGLRVHVHPFGTQPFVQDVGISIPSGFETYMALRQLRQTRLGGKYGKCGDGGEYEKYYGKNFSYTLDACFRTCEDREIAKKCNCIQISEKQFYNDVDQLQLPPCDINSDDATCVKDIENSYESYELNCNCNQPCRSTDYEYLFSYDQWPDDDQWHSLIDAVCETVSAEECLGIQQVHDDDKDEFLRKNFIHLKIFYRDLNIETIKETPTYEDIQFYSDIGGAVGLWLGASILTLFELCDLSIRVIRFCCKRITNKKRKDIKAGKYKNRQNYQNGDINGTHNFGTHIKPRMNVGSFPRNSPRHLPRINGRDINSHFKSRSEEYLEQYNKY